MFSSEAERGGMQDFKGAAEGVAPPPTRPGESSTSAGTDSQEREAKEGRGRRSGWASTTVLQPARETRDYFFLFLSVDQTAGVHSGDAVDTVQYFATSSPGPAADQRSGQDLHPAGRCQWGDYSRRRGFVFICAISLDAVSSSNL